MSESPFRLVRQRSSGPDGASYDGVDQRDNAAIVVQRVFLAQRMPTRWRAMCHRVRLATELRHRHVLVMREWEATTRDPFLITPAHARTLTDALRDGITRERALVHITAIADALAEAHRLGLMHGQLCPSRVALDDDDEVILDMFGLRTGDPLPLSEHDHACLLAANEITPASDVYALGGVCVALLTGQPAKTTQLRDDQPTSVADAGQRLDGLVQEMLDVDPDARPSIAEVLARLRRAETSVVLGKQDVVRSSKAPSEQRSQIGRYKIGELLGEGGMGRVYRAEDIADGRPVALKVLRSQFSDDEPSMRRFYREARVLAELDNPHIARFIEVNEDDGVHYLAMELVEGKSLNDVLTERTRLEVAQAMEVTREVALALADVHDLGIVHRDIKPANILLIAHPDEDSRWHVKLCDFGIAREIDVTDELLTQVGVTVGTPHYMSPEQCTGATVDAASDIYALGITLYKMLAGVVPFNAADARAIVYKHLAEEPPDIRTACPEIDNAGARLLAGMLAKLPTDRIPDARAMLTELERMRRGECNDIAAHPKAPVSDSVLTYAFEWQLKSAPTALWPYVSHTERLNRAIGLDAIDFTRTTQNGLVETYGKLRISGMLLDWREHPYEWVAPKRMGILREFSAGPFIWLRSTVELTPQDGGTHLRHTVQIEPRGIVGRAAAAMEVGFKAKRNLERVYQRIDGYCQQQRSQPVTGEAVLDPFEDPPTLQAWQMARLEKAENELLDEGIDAEVVSKLCNHVRWASPQDVARIRPRAFARRFTFDHLEVLRACLYGTKYGVFELLWDVICPRCQIPSGIADSLKSLREHQHCSACALDFEADFASSVEAIFRAHPEVRDSELGVYCIGGPGHTPHVIVQVRLEPGERFEADLRLDVGHYRVVGRQLATSWGFLVEHDAPLSEWELPLREGLPPSQTRIIGSERQRIVLSNDFDHEVVARIEKTVGREDAVTAAEAACSPLFRRLFPSEVLAPGHLIAVSKITLLLIEVCDVWQSEEPEAMAFARLADLQHKAEEIVAKDNGAIVKIVGDGVLASFSEPTNALRAGFAMLESGDASRMRMAMHAGAVMATSINDRLDYFGRIVSETSSLLAAASRGTLVVSEALYVDPGVSAMLAAQRRGTEMVQTEGVVGQALSA